MSAVAWPTVPLRDVLSRSERIISLDPEATYKEVTVRINGKGVVERRQVQGIEIASGRRYQAKSGQFILSRIDARHGASGLVPAELDGAIVTNDFPLFDVAKDRLDPAFLGWMSKTASFVELCKRASEGTTNRVRLSEDRFKALEIPLPPLDEQRSIVARVNELAAKVEEARELKGATSDEIEYVMPQAAASAYDAAEVRFGVERLGTLCHRITDGSHYTPQYLETGVPFISVKDITGGTINFDAARRISEEQHRELTKRCKPERNDVLLTKIGTTGYAKVVDVDGEFSIFVSLALLKLKKDQLLPQYAEHMLNSARLRQIAKQGTRGVGNQNLVLKFIRDFPMPVPPLKEQVRISDDLDTIKAKVDAVKALQAETAAELDAMLAAILDRAFKGEL